MARETSSFNHEILEALSIRDGERVLEIGYGHGRTILDAAASAPTATFAGIDIAADAERVASRTCRELIAAGRLDLRIGDAADLPWSEGAFDAVYTVHTIYFWERPERVFAAVRRVLCGSGRLVLGMRDHSAQAAAAFPGSVYHFYSDAVVTTMLRNAGFARSEVLTSSSSESLRVVIAEA
jgi:ubiquinone/menaquinone biosynthesis C-methylase UbiE